MSLKADSEPNNNVSIEEEVRTLFVSGLPVDIKPRELYLLFRPFKGYEGSLIKLTSKQPVGFVTFDSRSGAEAAKNALNVSSKFFFIYLFFLFTDLISLRVLQFSPIYIFYMSCANLFFV
ncbi:RNA-binding protein, mRNA-processing factor 2a [Ameca splendens]|uniref:RNA-binding protein, mRNA-processing factor 2a n=1 Tax=Ameca splendens TaxID=208324 RepID=A0ABV0ZRG1_9TELE